MPQAIPLLPQKGCKDAYVGCGILGIGYYADRKCAAGHPLSFRRGVARTPMWGVGFWGLATTQTVGLLRDAFPFAAAGVLASERKKLQGSLRELLFCIYPTSSRASSKLSYKHKKGFDFHRSPAILVALCGRRGIRTPGSVKINGFQDRRNRPLCHPSLLVTTCCDPLLVCGKEGIRTPETLLAFTHFPGEPVQPLLHLSFSRRQR